MLNTKISAAEWMWCEILRDLAVLYESRFREAKARIEAGPEASVLVTTYPSDLKIALHEVIANAADALEHAPIAPEERLCRLTVEDAGQEILIRVVDNGPGFSPDVLTPLVSIARRDGRKAPLVGVLGFYVARRTMQSVWAAASTYRTQKEAAPK